MQRSLVLAGIVTAVLTGGPSAALAAPGFTVTPVAAGDGADAAHDIALAPDGKIVVAGQADVADDGDDNIAVVRYTAAGALDTTFGGGDGIVTTKISAAGLDDVGRAVIVQPDNKIVVVGGSRPGLQNNFAVVRYTEAGVPDPTFGGGDGIVTHDFGSDDFASDVVRRADGALIVVGTSGTGGSRDFALAAYSGVDGSLDAGFDGPGTAGNGAFTFSASAFDQGLAALLQGTKLLVAGISGPSNSDFAVLRLDATTGALDTTWVGDSGTGNGVVRVPFSATLDDSAHAIAIDGSDVLAGGQADLGAATGRDLALVRLKGADGKLDTAFDGDGKLVTPVAAGNASDIIQDLAVDNAKLLGAGFSSTVNQALAARYATGSGALDATFDGPGGAGNGVFDFLVPGATRGEMRGIVLQGDGPAQDDGRPLLAGSMSSDATGNDLTLVRLDPATGALDSTFGTGFPSSGNPAGGNPGAVAGSAAAGQIGAVADLLRPFVGVASRSLVMDSRGRVRVKVSNPATETDTIVGNVSLATARPVQVTRRRRVKLGSARFSVAPGKTAAVRIRLSRRNRRLVRRRRKLRVRVTVQSVDKAGNRSTARRTVTLRPARRAAVRRR